VLLTGRDVSSWAGHCRRGNHEILSYETRGICRSSSEGGADTIREFTYSRKTKTGAILASSALVAIALASRASAEETLLSWIIALLAVAATVILWMQNKYALHVWAAVLAVMGIAQTISYNSGHHGILYWLVRVLSPATLIWFAYLLLKLGTGMSRGAGE
jgi:hypothetical protein